MSALKPTVALLAKLGSLIVHLQESISPGGHPFDLLTLDGLLQDPELQEWMREMRKLALIPEIREP